jgi:large subunit ribosomal protein L29
MMAKTEIRDLSVDELNSRLSDTREEYMNLRFQLSSGELTDFTRLRHTRRMIARLLTALTEREGTSGKEGVA